MAEHLKLIRKLNLRPFMLRSDWQGSYLLLVNYSLLLFALALPAVWSHWLAYGISLTLLGNRQLGLGILMHDCAHYALFKSKQANVTVGRWLCAAPIFAQFDGYQHYHLKHHANAGTKNDPDYPNYAPYPVKKTSLRRKIIRDCLGITGVKNFIAVLLMHAGVLEYDMAYKKTTDMRWPGLVNVLKNLAKQLYRPVIMHTLILGFCLLINHVVMYGVWWVAYFTTFSLFSRVRNAAEHASVPDLLDVDPRRHARTVYAGWLARLTVAPNHVNYHIEHHWLPQVPPYHLAKLHAYMKEQGILEGAEILPNYMAVMKKLA
ncbi:fatty acid desaturase family protein [Alteromonas facilis]|uniref:fatty acid desaturase family protein n=1 Tax=Alteromonas facilis TaxID=2048004 RepID=UPI000C2912C6|nr:fatty acid desaturase family protein [Alteromonas facilis]